jgi:ABC-type Mn2+/Zn2+ transport system ATPase subunit
MRHSRRPVVTASIDYMTFLHPVSIGQLVILRASVNRVFRTSMEVGVKVLMEDLATGAHKHTSSAYVTFVALDEAGKPMQAPPVVPETGDEKRRYEEAGLRRKHRLELRERVEWALAQTGLGDWRERNPRALSAGQKARLAVAGMLAMRPACLVLDESTALLDPLARGEMCALLARLHAGGMAIVAITHFMEEAAAAQRLLVLSAGRIALQGTPRQVFAHEAELEALGLGLPPAAAVAHGLRRRGVPLPGGLLTAGELAAALAAVREGISPGETVASGGVEW